MDNIVEAYHNNIKNPLISVTNPAVLEYLFISLAGGVNIDCDILPVQTNEFIDLLNTKTNGN
jgi:hypothetical protein